MRGFVNHVHVLEEQGRKEHLERSYQSSQQIQFVRMYAVVGLIHLPSDASSVTYISVEKQGVGKSI